jgi:hypothetical protein
VGKPLAVIGIDPGVKGAICLLAPRSQQMAFLETTTPAAELYDWFQRAKSETDLAVCMVEKVGAIHGTASNTTFAFGRSLERMEILPEICRISLDRVPPKKWQKFIGLVVPQRLTGASNAGKRKTFIKNEVATIATRLYPEAPIRGPRGGLLDGRSDALMIAHYAARTINLN